MPPAADGDNAPPSGLAGSGRLSALPVHWIDGSRQLAAACERWSSFDAIGIDTEFVRERTYFAALGLIQVSTPEEISLVDPRSSGIGLDPLRDLLQSAKTTKVLHSADQDIEVLASALDVTATPLFDTQIAAELTGLGGSLGYAGMVERLFGVSLEKGETRTDWTRRPLTQAQLGYAAQDVRWLLPAHAYLHEKLEEAGREEWHREEIERLVALRLAPPEARPPRGLDARSLAAFVALYDWREAEARARDLPRGFVVRDAALAPLARQRPTTRDEMEAIEELRPADRRRHGAALSSVLRQVEEIPREELPEKPPGQRLSPQRHRQVTKALRRVVAARSDETGLDATLLASRRVIGQLLDHALEGREPLLPEVLRGWRRPLVGEALLESLAELGIASNGPAS